MSDENQFRDLIRRIRERDEGAATELVRRYENAIRRVVRIHLRDTRMRQVLDSMDICQSVLASFFVRTALGQYELDTPENLLHLLTSITRNKLTSQFNRLHAQRRDIRRAAAVGDETANFRDAASDPSEQVSSKEILEKVRLRLSDEERFLADQRALGRGWNELAEELGKTAESLRKKLTRALDQVMIDLSVR